MAAAVAPASQPSLHYQLGRAEELYGRFEHAASNFTAAQRLSTAAAAASWQPRVVQGWADADAVDRQVLRFPAGHVRHHHCDPKRWP